MIKLGREVLWLSEADVASLLTMEEALQAVEEAFSLFGQKKTQLPAKIYLDYEPYGGDLRTMPAYLMGMKPASGVKIVNSNPKNAEKNLPTVTGIMTVVDPKTGIPQALMAAGHLTSLRTGAAGGVAAKYLARKDSQNVGLIGCGHQALTQLEALEKNFSLGTIFVWGKTLDEAQAFCSKNKKNFNCDFISCKDPQDTCSADIIVTTTPVRKPIVKASWIKPGTHINAIGADAPGKQELEIEILKKSRIYVDEWNQARHGGEINMAVASDELAESDIAGELGRVISGAVPGRMNDDDITVFDSTGLAIQDVGVAQIIFEKAQKFKKGQVLKFNG